MSYRQGLMKLFLGGICLAAVSASAMAADGVAAGPAAEAAAPAVSGIASSPVPPEAVKPNDKSLAGSATVLTVSQSPAERTNRAKQARPHRAAARFHWWFSRAYCRSLGCPGVHMVGTAY
jgi:hypothetical protein